ncbi:MAG TPA: hypothetical protein VGO00_16775, partial [Kofleriaceae bacterium]|nr:hypothetical protein [Kofleriaceae bacterium]
LALQRANALFRDKKFIEAAAGYYKFYKTAPNGEKGEQNKDLPVSLYNTALSYLYADHPKTAIALFKEFTSNTTKPFKESPYYLDAVRLTAKSYQSAFDYDNAIKTYLDLYALTKQAKRLGIKPPDPIQGEKAQTLEEIGLNALFNAAFAAELNRNFKQAVELYTQYQGVEKDRRKLDRAQWSIAGIYRQSGDVLAMVDALDRWRTRYGRDAGNEDDFVQSYYDTAALWKRKGRTPQAKAAGQDAINAWKAHGAIKKSKGAKLAAEWAMSFAEEHYDNVWSKFEIKTAAAGGTVAAVKKQLEAQNASIEKQRKAVEDLYISLDQFGVLESSMAAKVRFGDIQYDRAQKIANIPLPTLIANNPDAAGQFEAKRDEDLKRDLNEAKRDWQEVADAAKQGGVSNKWSDHAMENLAREFPDEFHTLRAPILQGTDAP